MSLNERINVGETWIALAQIYGKEISPPALKIMLDAVADIPYAKIMSALSEWPKHSKNQRHPLPAEIRESVSPDETPEDIARNVAGRIVQAVSQFGWNNVDRAKSFIGELGWLVVRRQGGWGNICAELNERNRGMIQAQMRDLALTLYRAAQAGTLNNAPALPETKSGNAKLENL